MKSFLLIEDYTEEEKKKPNYDKELDLKESRIEWMLGVPYVKFGLNEDRHNH